VSTADAWTAAVEAAFTAPSEFTDGLLDAAGDLAAQARLPRGAGPGGRAERAYSRPGAGLFLTAAQWADFDEHQALVDRARRKYGRFVPEEMMNVMGMIR
jgi:hypothetical protein